MTRRGRRWSVATLVVGMLALALVVPVTASSAADPATTSSAADADAANNAAANQKAYATTENYVIRYYPRFMTYFQTSNGQPNRLVGPLGMGPQYGVVVAINDDTLYASAYVNVSTGPQILTIPQAGTVYSLLTLDVFGNVFQTTIPPQTAGKYALVLKGYKGSIPAGTTRVEVPYPVTTFIIRADKYTSTGQNRIAQADLFRTTLRLASAADYVKDPSTGRTTLLPLPILAYQMKTIIDAQATTAPTGFLNYLQKALADPGTQPLTNSDRSLIRSFDSAYASAKKAAARGNYGPLNAISQAVRDAHSLIIDNWLSDTNSDQNYWIHPTNVGAWGTDYLDRASFNEYIQYGNNNAAAQYFDAFTDHNGVPLDGSVASEYQLTFPKGSIPQATRFWSLTAYLPPAVELVPNPINKYVVAQYTPGLVTNRDGSITIYLAPVRPPLVPTANWLPVPAGPFSVLLRVYGPTGNTVSGYVPPPIKPYGQF